MTLEFLQPAVGADMKEVDRVLREALASDVVLVNQVAEYIVGGGGKRLRPALLVLVARACGYEGRDHYTLAAVVEMIHTATLLHDDVVVKEGCRVDHLDHRGERVMIAALVAAGARHEDEQRRAQAFAAAANDVFRNLVNQHDVRRQGLPQDAIDLLHIGADGGLQEFEGHDSAKGEGGSGQRGAAVLRQRHVGRYFT